MSTSTTAYNIAKEKMLDNDLFSQWLGVELLDIKPGFCRLQMTIREEMTNGFKIAHGGICYSLADSALAFASNAHGKMAVSIETSISHLTKLKAGEVVIADAKEIFCSEKTGVYQVEIKNQENKLIALFKGTVYRSSKNWLEN
jgi:acyl-CoA thioesterase